MFEVYVDCRLTKSILLRCMITSNYEFLFLFFAMLGTEPTDVCKLDMCWTTELYPPPHFQGVGAGGHLPHLCQNWVWLDLVPISHR